MTSLEALSDSVLKVTQARRSRGGAGGAAAPPPTFLLMHDVKIEAFDPNRNWVSFSVLKFTHL